MNYTVKEISKYKALQMIQKYHYSNTLAKLNKHYLGFYDNDSLVGVITLGWGTRPRHTIQKLFPSLDTKDYYEIGRMAMTEEMPRNSESKMIADCIKWLKINEPKIKVLFTFADGMLGKAGYVYQASGFIYAGHVGGEMYLKDGLKIHPRKTRALFKIDENDKRLTIRPSLDQMKNLNIEHYKGKQYRYVRFLCSKTEKKRLMNECLVDLGQPFPKNKDISWTKIDLQTGKWIESTKPPYRTDEYQEHKQTNIFDFMEEE